MTGDLVGFGYRGISTVDQLRDVLEGVDLVADIRLSPYSWSPLWGRATRNTITAAGCRYAWLPDLGNLAYKTGGPVVIRDIEAIEVVLSALRAGADVALMCVCHDPTDCHRTVVADEAARRLPGLRVVER